jgi:hypothetical protein
MITRKELITALKGFYNGDCFCEAGIGNPMYGGKHDEHCKTTAALFKRLKAKESFEEEA